ncbi:unnamed protein product, partial [Prorocentrum cordatum]
PPPGSKPQSSMSAPNPSRCCARAAAVKNNLRSASSSEQGILSEDLDLSSVCKFSFRWSCSRLSSMKRTWDIMMSDSQISFWMSTGATVLSLMHALTKSSTGTFLSSSQQVEELDDVVEVEAHQLQVVLQVLAPARARFSRCTCRRPCPSPRTAA